MSAGTLVSTALASVFLDLTGRYPGAGQDVLFNVHTTDARWSGIVSIHIGFKAGPDEQVVD